jgi:leucyl-tRNA synthetase
MPSKTLKQAKFMAAVAHNANFAKKAGVPQSVGKEFNEADKGRKFSKGDDMNSMKKGYASGGMPMTMKDGKKVPAFAADGQGKMAKGGMAKGKMPAALAKHAGMPASKAHKGLKAGGSVGTTKMGSVKTATKPDGVISKGGTKGTMIKMARGGKTC